MAALEESIAAVKGKGTPARSKTPAKAAKKRQSDAEKSRLETLQSQVLEVARGH